MGLIPEQSFTVRNPAWWDLGAVFDLDHYPGKEEAMRLAGHDWDVVTAPFRVELSNKLLAGAGQDTNPEGAGKLRSVSGWEVHLRGDNLEMLHVAKESFASIPNSVAYEVVELLFDQGFKLESGGSMDGGKQCYLTVKLLNPITITGDDSVVLPFGGLSWCHDGTGALKCRAGTIRQVCQNTVTASEAEGKALGTDFTFRHTKNWRERIEDAKEAVRGIRQNLDVYRKLAEELATIPVTTGQRDLFVSEIIGDKGGVVSLSATTSDKVKSNIEGERAKINSLFFGPTIPEAHRLTAYGLHLAGVEYFDHCRAYKTKESYVRRTLLKDNPAKASLVRTIRELVAA
jgi:phage/plasmid-like protein (TIGR03299 family)